jgi:MFS transporter, DHA2 family, methylenomycin A resistance protein
MTGRVDGILFAACLGMLAVGANGTAIMAALPTMRHDLNLDGSEFEWAINAYLVVSAACIIPGGRFSDLAGANRIATLGLVLFAVASVIIAVAELPAELLAGRALQGLGAALAVPGTMAAIGTSPSSRAARIAAWAGFLMLGFSIGPLMGGALTHYLGWRANFWCIAVATLVATGAFALNRGVHPPFKVASLVHFDWVGFVLIALFMTSLVATLQALASLGTSPVRVVLCAVIACGSLFFLWRTERQQDGPLIDLRVFGLPAFVRPLVVGSIAMFSILTLLLYFNLYAQSPEGLGFSPIDAGMSLLPLGAGLLVFAFSAANLVRRFGARRVLGASMVLIAIAGGGVAVSAAARALVPLGVSLCAIGAALALPYATAPRMALATLPAEQAGRVPESSTLARSWAVASAWRVAAWRSVSGACRRRSG